MENLRERHSPIQVLHEALRLAGRAETGPMVPYVDNIRMSELLSSPSRAALEASPNPGWRTTRIMNQHTLAGDSREARVRIGDVVAFGVSHPGLTLGRWRHICLADDSFRVEGIVPTRS